MATPHHDRYGRPFASRETVSRQELAESPSNTAQREHLLRRLQDTLAEHYPHLLRRGVHAEVTISFKVEHGTIQPSFSIGIVRQYRREE